jgi:hypothetical protein
VDLPYESGLSISGRKLIAIKLKETRRKSAKRAQELGVSQIQRDFEMQQELQVRIKGKVGRKITVNVDFDDTKEDKRDISVVYQGDPEEVVQEAAFGDITLSLPSTEFVSYNKQLFGIRTRLKYKRAQLMAIGSRTKGVTETKRFTGTTQFERKEISDTSYIRRRYYNLAFDPARPPLQGTEVVFLDDRIATNNVSTVTFTAEDFAVNSSSYTGDFTRLSPGLDYTVDYARGILIFNKNRNIVTPNAVIAVNYQDAAGTRLADADVNGNPDPSAPPGRRFKLLKTENDLPLVDGSTELGHRREMKTFYDIGRNRIVRDNGRGNFVFKTIDLDRNEKSVILTNGARLVYPSNVNVDFEAGIFNIEPATVTVQDPPNIYDPTPLHRFSYQLEYRYKVKTFLVKPFIVLGSERVTVNGRVLTRDLDYFIDYDSGFLTFFNEDTLDENAVIEVTYEFAPFGGQLGQTLVGGRTEFSIVPDRVFVGSTALYTFAPRPAFLPDVRLPPNSLLVLEADTQLTSLKVPFTPLTASLSAEAAQSRENPNLFGSALVDSMEGIKQEDPAAMNALSWQYASNPIGERIGRPSSLGIGDEEVALRDILGSESQAEEAQRQRVLALDYNLTADSPAASIVHVLSKSGRDFSKKFFVNIWVEGSGDGPAGADLIVDAGQFNEDADGDRALDTEDRNLDGTLNQGEDSGIEYADPGPDGVPGGGDDGSLRIGANNGRIDSEDLDSDGALDSVDVPVRPGFPLFQLSAGASPSNGVRIFNPQTRAEENQTDLSFSGWRLIQVPLNVGVSEEAAFQAVKQVRVTIKGAHKGRVRLGNISFVGNRYEKATLLAGSSMTVSAVNNFDDPRYRTLLGNSAYNDLYKDDTRERLREQALSLSYFLPAGSSATTRVVYTAPLDFSKHKAFRFFLRDPDGASTGETFFLQLGTETDYFEYSVPVTGAYRDVWALEGVGLRDTNGDGTPDTLEPLNGAARVRAVGRPSLTSVGQIKMGVRNETASAIPAGELWINELHVTGARLKVGNARRVAADFSLPGWSAFGGRFREVDRNFQTLTSPITNQDRTESSAYAQITRFSFLPLNFNASQIETITPAAVRTGQSGLVSILEEGRVLSKNYSGNGDLVLPRLPRLGFGYERRHDDSNLIQQLDVRDIYTGRLDHAFSAAWDVLPGRRLTLRPVPQTLSATYRRQNYIRTFYSEKKEDELAAASSTETVRNVLFNNAKTVEYTDDWTARLGFVPWDGFNFSPNYSLKKVTEERRYGEGELDRPETAGFRRALSYEKALSQGAGFTSSLRLLRWLEPRLNYSITGTETNTLPAPSSPTAFGLKTLDRTADGEASWTLSVRELLPNFKPTQSLNLNNSYRIQDGDTYDNVLAEDDAWRRSLWLRDDLALDGSARRRQLLQRDTLRSNGNWSPLDWLRFRPRFQPLNTLGVSITYTHTDEHSEATGTNTDTETTTWPDLIFSLRDTEKLYGFQRFMGNSLLNLRTSRKDSFSVTNGVLQTTSKSLDHGTDYRFTLWRRYDIFTAYAKNSRRSKNHVTGTPSVGDGYNYSAQVGMTFGSWRLTPNYAYRTDSAREGTQTTQDLTVRTYNMKTRFDKAYPQGFRFPFSKKVFGNINRLTTDIGMTLEQKRSSLNVERDNTDTYSANVTGEYEISRNFRLSFGGGGSLINNIVKKDDGLMTFEITSTLNIQF